MNCELKLTHIGDIVVAECSFGKLASRTAWKVEESARRTVDRITADHQYHLIDVAPPKNGPPAADGSGRGRGRPEVPEVSVAGRK